MVGIVRTTSPLTNMRRLTAAPSGDSMGHPGYPASALGPFVPKNTAFGSATSDGRLHVGGDQSSMEDSVPSGIPHDRPLYGRCPREVNVARAKLKHGVPDDEVIVTRVPSWEFVELSHELPNLRVRVDNRGAREHPARGPKAHVDVAAVHFFIRPVALVGDVAELVLLVAASLARG